MTTTPLRPTARGITFHRTFYEDGVCPITFAYAAEERLSVYDILHGGAPTGFQLKRMGCDLAELIDPDGNEHYLSTSDLRSAKPEARDIVVAMLRDPARNVEDVLDH